MPAAEKPSWRFVALLTSLATIGPFAIDTYLPAFREISSELNTSATAVQQTLTAYLFAFMLMTLWHGVLSDRFGRRKIILWGVGIYVAASLGCALAQSLPQLLFFRVLQGLAAGSGMIVTRALVRDLYQGAAAQIVMSRIAVMFAIAPAIAPIIGGYLQVWFGWRAIFLFLMGSGALVWLASYKYLPETLPIAQRQPLTPLPLLRSYAEVLSYLPFVMLSLALAACFGGMFLYVLSAPAFLMNLLHLREDQFYWLFLPSTMGMMLGSWISGKVAERWRHTQTLLCACALMFIAALLNVATSYFVPAGVPWSIIHLPLYTIGMAMAMPTLTLLALDLFPARRGMAASCQSFIHTGCNSLVAGIAAPLLWGSTLHLALGMLSALLLCVVLLLLLNHKQQWFRE